MRRKLLQQLTLYLPVATLLLSGLTVSFSANTARGEDSKGSLTLGAESDLFGGVRGRYVEHTIFLDGNADREKYRIRKNSWVGARQAGAVIGVGNERLTLTEIMRAREFEGQDDPDEFGAIAITYRL